MRILRFSITLLAAACVSASLFGKDKPDYASWNTKQLRQWLDEHDIKAPNDLSQENLRGLVESNYGKSRQYTRDQFENAQRVFKDWKDDAVNSWDETQLREFLVKQGVVDPSGSRESLMSLAKQRYSDFTSAASSMSSSASTAASTAGGSFERATDAASSTISSAWHNTTPAVARVVDQVENALNDSKDYVYSTWDDNQIRTYLEDKGVIKSKQQATRDQLLGYMKNSYAKAANPAWEAWSDSYMHEWLASKGLVEPTLDNKRDILTSKLRLFYYAPGEYVWSTWSESDLKKWLVEHNIIKDNAQIKREKMQKLVADNYNNAVDTVWGGWKDSDLRDWLVEHGYLRSDVKVQRDELVKIMTSKYNEGKSKSKSKSNAYLTWPDARLRAFLRSHGLPEHELPTSRPGLLQEARIRYVQTTKRAEGAIQMISDAIHNGFETFEGKLGQILHILSGTSDEVQSDTRKTAEHSAKVKDEAASSASSVASSLSSEATAASQRMKEEL